MPRCLKTGISEDAKADADAKVRRAVEDILAAIEAPGDTAVREYSQRLVIAPQMIKVGIDQQPVHFFAFFLTGAYFGQYPPVRRDRPARLHWCRGGTPLAFAGRK